MVDLGAPIIKGDLAFLLSYSGEDMRQLFLRALDAPRTPSTARCDGLPNDRYTLDVNGEVNIQQYTEEVGVNRVNQALIDHGAYLQGQPADPEGFLTFFPMAGTTQLDRRVTIDETPGTVDPRGDL